MSINRNLDRLVNRSIRHTTAIGNYQRAQQKMLAQIKLTAFETIEPDKVDEWLCCIEQTIMTLNRMAIEIDRHYETNRN